MRRFLPAILATLTLIMPPLFRNVTRTQAAPMTANASQLAQVKYIYRGLSVTPPGKGRQPGKVKMPLFQQYALRTVHGQKASVGFGDGTVLHINQDTDAVLANPHVTQVRQGEVAEYLAPGTNHQVHTAAAIATAIGTTYDVRTDGTKTTFVVLHGALQVSNASGAVVVKSNHQTVTRPNSAPSAPTPVDARAVFAWTDGIPTPDLGEDVALDANGGSVLAFSSQTAGPGDTGHAFHVADGLLSQGWRTATGKVANQSVTIGFVGGNFYRISDVIIDPAASGGALASEDLKDFEIRVSSTDTKPTSFTTVLRGTCKAQNTLQHFKLPAPVRARYIQLVAIDNYGSKAHISVAEFEAVATVSLFAQPIGIAADTKGFAYVADTNANRVEKLSSKGKVIARWGAKGRGPGQFLRPQAVAVDHAGNIYVADTYNNRVQKLSPRGKPLLQIGEAGLKSGQFTFPKGIAVDSSGSIYVSDTTAGRIEKFSVAGKLIAIWSDIPTAGTLSQPQGLAVDSNGDIFVADSGNNRVLHLTADGKYVATIGSAGAQPGQFDTPSGVAVDASGNVYVADSVNARIQKIDTQGHATVWGQVGVGAGQFLYPTDVAVAPNGRVLVDDMGNSRIQVFGTGGQLQAVWGKYATVADVLGEPGGIASDGRGNVYVVDDTNDRLQQRDASGHVRAILGHHGFVAHQQGKGLGQFWWPHGATVGNDGAIYVADTFNNRIQILANRGPINAFGQLGTGPGQFYYPFGVAIDGSGNIYVADTYNNRVQKLSPSGQPLAQWGSKGSGSDQFLLPYGIAVDSHGNIYVSDFGDDRVQKLAPDGSVLAVWGTAGARPHSRFFGPEGLTIDNHDNLYVADSGHNSVQKINPAGQTVAVFDLPGPNASPDGVAVDGQGNIYASDGIGGRVIKFASTGELIGIWD